MNSRNPRTPSHTNWRLFDADQKSEKEPPTPTKTPSKTTLFFQKIQDEYFPKKRSKTRKRMEVFGLILAGTTTVWAISKMTVSKIYDTLSDTNKPVTLTVIPEPIYTNFDIWTVVCFEQINFYALDTFPRPSDYKWPDFYDIHNSFWGPAEKENPGASLDTILQKTLEKIAECDLKYAENNPNKNLKFYARPLWDYMDETIQDIYGREIIQQAKNILAKLPANHFLKDFLEKWIYSLQLIEDGIAHQRDYISQIVDRDFLLKYPKFTIQKEKYYKYKTQKDAFSAAVQDNKERKSQGLKGKPIPLVTIEMDTEDIQSIIHLIELYNSHYIERAKYNNKINDLLAEKNNRIRMLKWLVENWLRVPETQLRIMVLFTLPKSDEEWELSQSTKAPERKDC